MLETALALAALALPWPTVAPDDLAKFEKKRAEVLQDAGQRHLDLGLWARKKGLVTQATNELFLAVELSERTHYGANHVLGVMRSLDDGFWKKRRSKPSKSSIKVYENKAERARRDDQEERLDLAAWALKKDLVSQAHAEYLSLLRRLDSALELDDEGRIVLEHGEIPERASTWIRDGAVSINGRLYLRDAFLEHLPEVGEIFEAESELLRVRVTTSLEEASALHAMASALLPILEEDLGGRPGRRMNVFVFATKELYDAYLESADLASHQVAAGMASSATRTAVVDAEGRSEEVVRGIVLHELTHLFGMGLSRGVLPDWYHEGLAETYGGPGTFTWDGETLTAKGLLSESELARLRDPGALFPLTELLRADGLELIAESPERGRTFYVQSWALVRYLREAAPKEQRALFADWEARCLGAALGAGSGGDGGRNTRPAEELFRTMFASELAELETELFDWIERL